MFRKIPYSDKELTMVEEIQGRIGIGYTKLLNTPVSPRQNYDALYYDKKPFWMPVPAESRTINVPAYAMNLGRGIKGISEDIVDCFGLHWEYIPDAGGSIVHPGNPLVEDVNDWRDTVKIPNIDEWDWESDVKIDTRFSTQTALINGVWFERLISFMDFIPAAVALIDEEQTDAIKELFQATTDMACRIVDKIFEYYPAIDQINIHDDWGAQKAPFFSNEVAYELFVPFMKQFTDHIHSKGRIATIHSCGCIEERVQCFIDGGFDQWSPQLMNNIKELYENYGDKIVLGVWPEGSDWKVGADEEAQRAAARKFVEDFNKPGKPSTVSQYATREAGEYFLEEVYIHSRKLYAERG